VPAGLTHRHNGYSFRSANVEAEVRLNRERPSLCLNRCRECSR
jgi:hypothetical protein